MGRIQFFVVEPRRRNVLRAAAFYAASTWLLVQIATQVFPFFHIAEWVVRWIVIASVVGFPFAMLLSWFYEWTPQGIKRDSDMAPDAPVRRETGRKLNRAIIVVLALAVVALVSDRFVLHSNTDAPPEKSIAVLPLVNESGDSKDEYFSDGLSEELTAALSQISGLTVMGRNSSFQFKHSNAGNRVIGEKLGVATLLEGSVRREGSRVRIVAALINAADGRQLWSQTYDGELDDVFTLQSEIAQAVAEALQVRLLPARGEKKAKHHVPKFETYDHYLLGTHLMSQGVQLQTAARELRQAVALDPAYAEAWALLAMAEHDLGQSARANRTLDAFVAARSKDAGYRIAEVYAWFGDNDKAFVWLDRAMRQHDTSLIRVKYDRLMSGLHADARFDLLLESMGLPPSSAQPAKPTHSPKKGRAATWATRGSEKGVETRVGVDFSRMRTLAQL